MSRKANPNRISSELRALAVIELYKPVTPTTINQCVGSPYASKYISLLKDRGFVFTIQKEGKHVVSYTLVKEPHNAVAIRASVENGEKSFPTIEMYVTPDPDRDRSPLWSGVLLDRNFDSDPEEVCDHYGAISAKVSSEDVY